METDVDVGRLARAESRGDASLAYEYSPARDGNVGAPMLILLHGVHSNEHDMLGLASYLDRQFQLVSARAPEALVAGAYAWFRVRFTAGGPIINEAEEQNSRVVLSRFVEEMLERYRPRKIFLYGFSQGGIMALSIALTQPGLVDGIVVMNGRLLREIISAISPADPLRRVQIFMAHGLHDDVIPIGRARSAREFLGALPVQLDYREYSAGHRIAPEAMRDANGWLANRMRVALH